MYPVTSDYELAPPVLTRNLMAVSALFSPIWLYALLLANTRNQASFPVTASLVVAVNVVLIRWLTRHSQALRSLLQTGYAVRVLAVGVYLIVLLKVYGIGDALLYFDQAAAQSEHFWRHGELPGFTGAGAAFVSYITSYVLLLVGSSIVPATLVFASAAFWGSVFFLEAFHLTFPHRKLTSAAVLLFFLPSPVFWTATVGKDALIYFLSGLFCLAYFRLLREFRPSMFALLLGALWLSSLIRPHIALMLAVSALATILLGRGVPGLSRRMSRIVGFGLLVAAIGGLLPRVEGFLQLESLSLASSREFLEWQLSVTTRGGSSFGLSTSFLSRVLSSPFLLVRPFPWEVHNLTSLIATLESTLLVVFAAFHRRQIAANLRLVRREPIFIFGVVMTVMFLFAFSSIGNFGIVSRQRVMLLPWLFVFFTSTRQPIEAETPAPQPVLPRLASSSGQPGLSPV